MINNEEKTQLENYLKKKFCNKDIQLVLPNKADKPAEVFINKEFIGTIYKDIDEGEVSYDFNIAILGEDLK